jgi:putative ABC transport system ATP-binding protein
MINPRSSKAGHQIPDTKYQIPDTPLIQLKSLKKSYFNEGLETPVLFGIDLVINKGEFVAIMGPSGSGKSTLMHILGFLDTLTGGEYVFQGQPAAHFSDDMLARIRATKVSFVFQSFNLLPRATVTENVMLPLLYHPTIPLKERQPRALKAIDTVGLTPRKDYLSNQLSGGQKQRVAIARALVTEPEVIFADEPTGNLDSASGIAVMEALQELHRQGHTIILVTHERTTAEHAERIIRLRDGKMEADERGFKQRVAKDVSELK